MAGVGVEQGWHDGMGRSEAPSWALSLVSSSRNTVTFLPGHGTQHTSHHQATGQLSSSTKSWGHLLSVDKPLFVWQLDLNKCVHIYSMLL